MTTSTCSASANGLPDRRHFLSTIAGAGALGLPALPALAGTPGPIEVMYPDFLALEAACDAGMERTLEAEARYEEPARPRWHPVHSEGGYSIIATSPGRGTCVLDDGEENIAYLRELIAQEYKPDAEDSGCRNKVRGRRARKTLAQIEAWRAKDSHRRKVVGLTKAEAAEDQAAEARRAHRAAIFAIEATTFRELAFQAATVNLAWSQTQAERVLERLAELAGISTTALEA